MVLQHDLPAPLKSCLYELIYLSILQSQVYVNDQFISIKYSLYSFE